MRVKILRKVPLAKPDGTVFYATPGAEHDVSPSVAEALLRGHDADILSEATGPSLDVMEPPATVPKKRGRQRTKDLGAAPENK